MGDLSQLLKFRIAQVLGGTASRNALNHSVDLVVVEDVIRRQGSNEHAAARHAAHQRLILQHDECFTHGKLTDAEHLGDLVLVDLLARPELSRENQVADVVSDYVLEVGTDRSPADGRWDHRHFVPLPAASYPAKERRLDLIW